jgi:hypothetical protein
VFLSTSSLRNIARLLLGCAPRLLNVPSSPDKYDSWNRAWYEGAKALWYTYQPFQSRGMKPGIDRGSVSHLPRIIVILQCTLVMASGQTSPGSDYPRLCREALTALQPDENRILTILKGSTADEIRCVLRVTPLDGFQYEAVSYPWGAAAETHCINILGRKHKTSVRANLY